MVNSQFKLWVGMWGQIRLFSCSLLHARIPCHQALLRCTLYQPSWASRHLIALNCSPSLTYKPPILVICGANPPIPAHRTSLDMGVFGCGQKDAAVSCSLEVDRARHLWRLSRKQKCPTWYTLCAKKSTAEKPIPFIISFRQHHLFETHDSQSLEASWLFCKHSLSLLGHGPRVQFSIRGDATEHQKHPGSH